MAKLNTIIPDDLNKQVREKVARKYGVRRGAMKDAIIEALKDWVSKKDGTGPVVTCNGAYS
jgi:tryptophan synthase beta subunit